MTWPLKRLEDVCQTTSGGTPSRARAEYFGGSIPWIKSGDLTDALVSQCEENITEVGLKGSNAKLFPRGTLLIAMYGATVGRLGILSIEAATNQAICGITPSSALDSKFLFYFLLSQRRSLIEKSTGGAQPNISQRIIRDLQVPIPPKSYQLRTVDLLARAEGIVRLCREAQQKAAQLIPAIFIDMFGDPATNPKQWPIQRLGDVVQSVSGGTPAKARPEFWDGDLPWVSPKDMKRNEIVDAEDHVNRRALSETSLKLVPPDSVLIVVRGMILVHTVPVAITQVPVTINQDMKALRPASCISAPYLQWVLKVNHAKLLGAVSTAAHGTKKLDTDALMAMPVPVPPPQFQQQFGARLLAVRSIVSQQLEASARAKSSFNALLARAFG